MKKYSVILITFIFVISLFTVATSKQINKISNDDNPKYLLDDFSAFHIVNTSKIKSDVKDISLTPRVHKNINKKYDYIIITSNILENSINSSAFLSWKESLGYNIKIIKITDKFIQDQPGSDLPAKIRNFLREYYQIWGIKYVLIVGDHETIPMRYCYPNPNNHYFDIYSWLYGGEVPTDYYYADLSLSDSESWDSDGDGYFGEFNEDKPDFKAEVYVGRIPTSDPYDVLYTLNKIVAYEKDTSEWKNNALLAGSMLFYKNENHQFEIDHDIDGASCLYTIEEDIMDDWTVSHFSEKEGLSISKYNWNPLTEPDFTKEWRNGKYAVVNWAGHGSSTGVGRTIWDWDDGDGIPEHTGKEIIGKPQINIHSQMEDDYPSIVFAVSCLVGYPEQTGNGNLGIDLLTKKSFGAAVAICSATRPAAISINFSKTHSGAEALCYEFNHYMINGPEGSNPIGVALYESKFYVHLNFGWDDWFYEYKNMYNYNLYGDPSMMREGLTNVSPEIDIIHPESAIYLSNSKIIPFFTPVIIGKIDIVTNYSENVHYVEFYVDGILRETDIEEPYQWTWDEKGFLKHNISVIAIDKIGNEVRDETTVWKFF
jgi:hypothetical protein